MFCEVLAHLIAVLESRSRRRTNSCNLINRIKLEYEMVTAKEQKQTNIYTTIADTKRACTRSLHVCRLRKILIARRTVVDVCQWPMHLEMKTMKCFFSPVRFQLRCLDSHHHMIAFYGTWHITKWFQFIHIEPFLSTETRQQTKSLFQTKKNVPGP